MASFFSDSSFNSFLLEVTFLFKFFSLSWKSVFFIKLAISLLFATFACANLAAKFSDADLLNSSVVVYLSWSGSALLLLFFFSILLILCYSQFFWLS